jgi:hypothetical protein
MSVGLLGESGKRLGVTLGSGQFRGGGYGLATAPKPATQGDQQHEDDRCDERERQVGWHHQPLHSGGLGPDHTAFSVNLNYPHG